MAKERNQQFVFDGRDRLIAATVHNIRADVEREYADRLYAANWFTRALIRLEMRREIKRRAARLTPPDALYFSA